MFFGRMGLIGGALGPLIRTWAPWVAIWAACPYRHLSGLAAHERVHTAAHGAQLPESSAQSQGKTGRAGNTKPPTLKGRGYAGRDFSLPLMNELLRGPVLSGFAVII